MRKALSLVELIFTIVIIAIVFTVIPKIVLSLNKADSFTVRQDAMLNGISMMKMISRMPWDQNNTNSRDILHVQNSDCNQTTFRRVGSFIGSRTCEHNLTASINIYNDELNDIGDFNRYDENTSNFSIYGLHVEVKYIDSNISYAGQSARIVLDRYSSPTDTTNLKYIDINVSYQGERGERDRDLVQFNYTSANIGQMIINKRVW